MSDPYAHLPYRPCAGIMLRNSDGLVFVGQRLDSSSEAWQMPQGGVDPGEDPLEAAIRELGKKRVSLHIMSIWLRGRLVSISMICQTI